MVALEAWALGKPVLANGRCDVLRGQCVRSNGGLYYENFEEFAEALYALEATGPLGAVLGAQRPRVLPRHYTWPVIERKYLEMFDRLKREPAARPLDPLPGFFARREAHAAARPRGHERGARPGPVLPLMAPRVHQILATLGYGDAIGHEVLGITAALRAAGYESEIIVETADPRLEDLTVDYRDAIDEIGPDDLLIHHFSLGSRASRTAFALPARMILIYHNITPPEYFLGVHEQLVRQCYHGRRELLPYRSRVDLALGDSEFNRQELEALGFEPDRRAAGRARTSRTWTSRPTRACIDAYDDEWTNILFVGRVDPQQAARQRDPLLPRVQTLYNPRARLILAGSYGGFEGYLAQLHALVARLGVRDVHILGQVTNEELTALYDVADLFLCASEHEGFCVPLVEAFYKRVPVLALRGHGRAGDDGRRRHAVRHTRSAARGGADERGALRRATWRIASSRRRTRRSTAARAGLRGAGGPASSNRCSRSPRRPAAPVAYDFWRQFKLADELEEVRAARGRRRFAPCRLRRSRTTSPICGHVARRGTPA